jgi:hypothetical protein
MFFITEKLSWKPKPLNKVWQSDTEGRNSKVCQGQRIGNEPAMQNIIFPRVLGNSSNELKIYSELY